MTYWEKLFVRREDQHRNQRHMYCINSPVKPHLVKILISYECEPKLGRTPDYARWSTLEQCFETLLAI